MINKLCIFIVTLIVLSIPLSVDALGRGILVEPAELIIENVTSWPYTEDLVISNPSNQDEWIEVVALNRTRDSVTIKPSRFALEGNSSVRVTVSFDEPADLRSLGVLRVSAVRTSSDGFSTGTGVEVPYVATGRSFREADLRAAVGGIDPTDRNRNTINLLVMWGALAGVLLLIGYMTRRVGREL